MSADNRILVVRFKDCTKFKCIGGDKLYDHFEPNMEGINYAYLYIELKSEYSFEDYRKALELAGVLNDELETEYGVNTLEFDNTWDEFKRLAVDKATLELLWLQGEIGERSSAWIWDQTQISDLSMLVQNAY